MALDSCHEQVVNALVKAGWTIEASSYFLEHDESVIYPDIRARLANGNMSEIIIVEVKCFTDESSYQSEFYRAVGQYIFYEAVMMRKQISAKLYLSVPVRVYETYFSTESVMTAIQLAQISLLIVDIDREVIVQWID